MKAQLPKNMRPRGLQHRALHPGIDVPTWFIEQLQGIDSKLHLVWHPWCLLYDSMMNVYEGDPEDPRFVIGEFDGQEIWGFPMTDGEGTPVPNNHWHVWRLCDPYGWAHIVELQALSGEYLQLLLKRLYWQAQISLVPAGQKALMRQMQQDQEEKLEKGQAGANELWGAVQDENKWLMKEAMENFDRGHTAPTNPQKEQIISYPGQKNRSRIIRPLEDSEGGLIIPEKW